MKTIDGLFEIGTCMWFAEDTKPTRPWIRLDLDKANFYVCLEEMVYDAVMFQIEPTTKDEKEEDV